MHILVLIYKLMTYGMQRLDKAAKHNRDFIKTFWKAPLLLQELSFSVTNANNCLMLQLLGAVFPFALKKNFLHRNPMEYSKVAAALL